MGNPNLCSVLCLSSFKFFEEVSLSVCLTYSCSNMESGDGSSSGPLDECRNLVFLKISATSEFLLISSPSFSPEVKWVHTKQNVVWYNVMLIDIEPYYQKKKTQRKINNPNACRRRLPTKDFWQLATKSTSLTTFKTSSSLRNDFLKILQS